MTARCALYTRASHISSQSRTRDKLNGVFPSPPPVFPKISPYSPGSRWKREGVWLIVRALTCIYIVSKISNLCDSDPPTSQTNRQTDGRMTCKRKTTLCTIVHRAVKTSQNAEIQRTSHQTTKRL